MGEDMRSVKKKRHALLCSTPLKISMYIILSIAVGVFVGACTMVLALYEHKAYESTQTEFVREGMVRDIWQEYYAYMDGFMLDTSDPKQYAEYLPEERNYSVRLTQKRGKVLYSDYNGFETPYHYTINSSAWVYEDEDDGSVWLLKDFYSADIDEDGYVEFDSQYNDYPTVDLVLDIYVNPDFPYRDDLSKDKDNAVMSSLRDDVVGEEAPTVPEMPASPEEGKESEATKEYAEYVIGLAGDEWDAEADAWAAEDGRYASALSSYEISNDGATYEAAQSAYYLAYQLYSEKQTEISSTWSTFVNELMSAASVQVMTLVS